MKTGGSPTEAELVKRHSHSVLAIFLTAVMLISGCGAPSGGSRAESVVMPTGPAGRCRTGCGVRRGWPLAVHRRETDSGRQRPDGTMDGAQSAEQAGEEDPPELFGALLGTTD